MSVPDAPASLLGKGWTHLSSFDDLDDDEYEPEEVCLSQHPPFYDDWLTGSIIAQ